MPSFSYTLGLSCFYHDSAAVLIKDSEIIAAAQEERFTRIKNDPAFPCHAILYCLKEAGISIDDVGAVVYYDKPFLTFERLLETYLKFAPRGLKSFLKGMPIWLKEKWFLRSMIKKEMTGLFTFSPKIFFSEHHLSHAASAFYPSGYKEAAILTVDGVGEWATCTIAYGKDKDIKLLKQMRFPHSWGLFYSAVTYFLGFKVNSGEYKLMGLAPYGNPDAVETKRFYEIFKTKILNINDDGSVWLNPDFFAFTTDLRMVDEKKWAQVLGIPQRTPESTLTQSQSNLALAAQWILGEGILKLVAEAKKLTQSENLVMAGGVALNCVANYRIYQARIFKNIWIQPAANDAGGALGAALAFNHIGLQKDRSISALDSMKGSYLGPAFDEKTIEHEIKSKNLIYTKFNNSTDLNVFIAQKIISGNIVGWFQGRMEWGPRALGNRSILANPASVEMQSKLNQSIKFRESFRPFAPAVIDEDAHVLFEFASPSPYMLFTAPIRNEFRERLPDNFNNLSIHDRLKLTRSKFSSITHMDFSARIQTVHQETNPKFWSLLSQIKQMTGFGLVINTSFNVRGEPIVCRPIEAIECFLSTHMDILVLEKYVIVKTNQSDSSLQHLAERTFLAD